VTRDSAQVNVVGHQAVAQDGHAKLCRSVLKQVDVEAAVVVSEEDALAVVAPLSDVMRNALIMDVPLGLIRR
jgi:hypothetical protein